MIHKNKFLLIGNAMFFLFHIQFLTPAEIRGENLSKKNSFFQKKLFPSIIPSILTAVSTYWLSKKTPALSPRVSCFLALSCGAIPLFIKKLYNCVLKKKENDKIEKIFFFLYAAPSIFQYYETINISANIKYSLIIGYGILKMYIQEPEPESEEELPAEPKDKNHSIIPAILENPNIKEEVKEKEEVVVPKRR